MPINLGLRVIGIRKNRGESNNRIDESGTRSHLWVRGLGQNETGLGNGIGNGQEIHLCL